MILVTSGPRDGRAFSSTVQFARQLASIGMHVMLDERSAPENMDESQKYEAAAFLSPVEASQIDHILIIGAHAIGDEVIRELHSFDLPHSTKVTAIGSFATPQAQIKAQSVLAFALGREPEILDLSTAHFLPFLGNAISPMVFASTPKNSGAQKPRLLIYVPAKRMKKNRWLAQLDILSSSPHFSCQVVSEADGKNRALKSRFNSISAFSISELAPETLASMADVLIYFGDNIPGERMATLALELLGRGGALVDCTERAAFMNAGAPAIRGAVEIAGLEGFLKKSVLPNLDGIRSELAGNAWLQQRQLTKLVATIGLKPTALESNKPKPRTVFVPTNGVGLGHAQRCSQVASAMDTKNQIGFAAFPSCVPMLQSKGFDCLTLVSKSGSHRDPYANDLLNYLRLSRTVTKNDHLVFDGGFVFNSIYRTILENRLSATWIRRGLWQAGQSDHLPLERERAFEQVIIPQEAFPELNADYSFGSHIHKVGPIVQGEKSTAATKSKLRAKLADHFDRPFEKLVVTMLGGGVAADRSAQLQILASQFQSRADCLHLIVVWPNATVSANLFGWDNTHVVRTHRALALCQASDFVVSAAGYNGFHEALYHQIPAIFIPQMAAFMDNQERRAMAATERGLATTVQSDQLLSLQREVAAYLDGGKASLIASALRNYSLPKMGNESAARLIQGASQ